MKLTPYLLALDMKGLMQVSQAFIAPIATPFAPAVFLGNGVYRGLAAEGVLWQIALIAAVMTVIGTETTGALGFYMAMRAFQSQRWLFAILATVSSVAYIVIIVGGIVSLPNGYVIAILAIITAFAYLNVGMFFADRHRRDEDTEGTQVKIDAINAEKNLTNAQTRRMRQEGVLSSRSLEHLDTPVSLPVVCRLDVVALLDSNPDLSARAIARQLDISPTTASKHKKLWKGA